jgi:hypothetical protein
MYLVVDGCDDGHEQAVLYGLLLPVDGHFGQLRRWEWAAVRVSNGMCGRWIGCCGCSDERVQRCKCREVDRAELCKSVG